jgi:hypothetical protein
MDLVKLRDEIDEKKQKNSIEEKVNVFANIKEKVEEIDAVVEEQKERKKEIKPVPRIISLNIDYETPSGEKKSCKLTSKVMDNVARIKYDKLLAALASGYIFDQLPIETQNRYASMARILSQTIDPPDWLLEACGEDLEFAYELTLKLLEHEKRFFRYAALGSEETAFKRRFSVDTKAFD